MSTSQLDEAILFLQAVASTKYLSIASFAVLVYDHLICLDQEFEFFWKGEWTLTRVLYFINRYIPPVTFIIHLVYILSPGLSIDVSITLRSASDDCTAVARMSASFLVFGVYVVEAILMTRVYFLWTHNRPVQWLICGVFAAGTTVAVVFAAIAIHQLNSKELPAVLFLATVFRIRTPIASCRNKIVVIRLLRDGGIFYCVVLASVAFAMSGSLMEDFPKIALPALLSNYLLAIHSICASHLILSIHSLAADIGSDPTFLLSNIEISRVVWRKGASANELIVDLGDCDSRPSIPMEPVDDLDPLAKEGNEIRATPSVRSTRIGMLYRNNSQVDLAARALAKCRPNSAGTS
ncbi:hypothetical protein ACEPAG_4082 [Sanghuangporus baumii]